MSIRRPNGEAARRMSRNARPGVMGRRNHPGACNAMPNHHQYLTLYFTTVLFTSSWKSLIISNTLLAIVFERANITLHCPIDRNP